MKAPLPSALSDTVPTLPSDPAPVRPGWVTVSPRQPGSAAVPLRCWWAPAACRPPRGGVLVLPEVFGVNSWVRSVAGRLAEEGYAALAVPLFSRTAPELELGYGENDLIEGRSHKDRTTTAGLLADVSLAADWLLEVLTPHSTSLGCVGFCFGGHVALLAATLPQVSASCDFYGAGVATGRPGGGPPSLDLVPRIRGRLLCLCGTEDPLIPPGDQASIAAALERANRSRGEDQAHRLLTLEGGHGFMCESREDHRPAAAASGWRHMLEFFSETIGRGEGP